MFLQIKFEHVFQLILNKSERIARNVLHNDENESAKNYFEAFLFTIIKTLSRFVLVILSKINLAFKQRCFFLIVLLMVLERYRVPFGIVLFSP